MYRAKSRGSGGSELFDSAMHEQVMERLKMEAELRKALDANRLTLHYQPIVLTSSGKVEGFEALIRWEQDDGRFISPGVFIPIAEQCGLIIPLGSWILRTGCRRVAQWKREYSIAPPLYISINVSARQFSHPSFIRDVADAIQETGANPQCVRLELTESVAMKDAASAEQSMSQLRALGVKLSIDDFGTGYSSLSYLRKFPVDTLKIDQSFIAGMEGDKESYAIVKTVVALARSLSMEVVAEGVETPEQLEKLNLAGCDFAQGFWFSRPLPEEKVDHFLRTNLESAMVSN
jgi:Amt family ammonium transporter